MKIVNSKEAGILRLEGNRTNEILFSLGIIAFGATMLYYFITHRLSHNNDPLDGTYSKDYTPDSRFEWVYASVFGIVTVWLAIVNMGDTEACEVNIHKKVVKFTRGNLINTRTYVHYLEELLDVVVKEHQVGGKTKYQVAFIFEEGIEIPLTSSFYLKKEPQQDIADKVNAFLHKLQ